MPYFGVLTLLAQILCAVHVARTGRPYYWIYPLFSNRIWSVFVSIAIPRLHCKQ